MTRRRAIFATFTPAVAVVALLLPVDAPADAPPPPPEAAPPAAAAEPQPIPDAEIPRRADEVERWLPEVRAASKADPATEAVAAALPEALEGIARDERELDGVDLERGSATSADTLRTRWERRGEQLEEWRKTVEARAQTLLKSRDDLLERRAVWQKTADALDGQDRPGPLRERVAAVLAELEQVQSELEAPLSVVLDLQRRLSDGRSRIDGTLQRIAESRNRQLFRIDRPPLWSVLFNPEDGSSIAQQVRTTWTQDAQAVAFFLETYRRRLIGHAIVFALLTVALFALRRRAGGLDASDDEDLGAALRVVNRPLPVAMLVCLFPVVWVYPQAPLTVLQLTLLAMLGPLLWLIPHITPRRMHGAFYGLSTVYVLLKLYQLAADASLLERLLLLLVTLSALASMVRMIRPGSSPRGPDGGWIWRSALAIAPLGVAALGASLVANVLGALELAGLLAAGTINAVYVGVVLYGMVVVLRGVIAVVLRTGTLSRLRSISNHRDLVKQRGVRLLNLLAVGLWIWAALRVFDVRVAVLGAAGKVLSHEWALGSLEITLGDVLAFALTLAIAYQLSRFLRWILGDDVLPRLSLPRGVAGSMLNLVHYTVMAVGFLAAVAAAGLQLDRLTIIVGALGVGIGFGLQNLVSNFVSGLILMFERPISVGDTVQFATTLGEVRHIGLRASVVRTFEGAEVIVPNADLISTPVINWTLSDRTRRLEIPVGVAYGTDPEKVLALLVRTAKADPDVLDHPEPFALFKGFGESSLNFQLRFWTAKFDSWVQLASRVTVAVNNAIVDAGIEIPFPQRDLHLRSVDSAAGAALGPAKTKTGDS